MWAAVSGSGVGDELERRREPDAGLLADLGAEHALGALQRRGGVRALLVGAEDGVEDRGLLQVAGDPGVGDGDEAEARVLDPDLERLGDDDLDAVGELAGAGGGQP